MKFVECRKPFKRCLIKFIQISHPDQTIMCSAYLLLARVWVHKTIQLRFFTMTYTVTNFKVSVTHYNWYSSIVIRLRGFCSHYHENYKQKPQHKGRNCVKSMHDEKITIRSTKEFRRINSCKALLQMQLYRVIHKSLRNFRTRLRNNQDRHDRKEHINR